MLKKLVSLTFIITALSFFTQIIGMKAPTIEDTKPAKIPKLKHLTILKINNNNLNLPKNFPHELRTKCLWSPLKPLVIKHFDSLKELQDNALKITEDDLKCHYELLNRLVDVGGDIKPILSHTINKQRIFSRLIVSNLRCNLNYHYTVHFPNLTLQYWNLLLKILIKRSNNQAVPIGHMISEQELIFLNTIISYAFEQNKTSLCKLLIEKDLLPRLDHTINDKNNSFLMYLVLRVVDIEILQTIIDKEKDKEYNWEKLFSNSNIEGCTAMHFAAIHRDIRGVILLELMKYKHLIPDRFINMQNKKGLTPLIMTALASNYNNLKALVNHNADPNLKSNDGLDALDHIKEQKELFDCDYLAFFRSNYSLYIDYRLSENFNIEISKAFKEESDKCIQLLKAQQPITRICRLMFKYNNLFGN